jgi:tetratricopeptide (TPR) repeat protein
VASYIRGLESLAQKDDTGATAFLREALDLNPANAYAGEYLTRLYFGQKSFAEITRLYDKFGINTFRNSPDSLARICLSFWQTGQKDRAKDLLATAREYFPENPTIKSTAGQMR